MSIIPNKLKPGDGIRIISPSRSLSIVSESIIEIAKDKLEKEFGFKVTIGEHAYESDDFISSSITSRIEDLHNAFRDTNVRGILTSIGGFNSNQLLRYIDWDLIRNNPKVFCGFSDITALNDSIYAKTGLITYSGPHYSNFGQLLGFEYTLEYFKKCLLSEEEFYIKPSDTWSDDRYWKDQEDRNFIDNSGWMVINKGRAEGNILGANLCTFNLLQGTEYFPNLGNSVLFIEDDDESDSVTFDRDLQSLIHLESFKGVKGIVIGRFQKESEVSDDLLRQIMKSKKELDNIPVVSGVDFGHTDPKITFPIGGGVELKAEEGKAEIKIVAH
jgi:muramoyltetrapeptide carboxypeptidase